MNIPELFPLADVAARLHVTPRRLRDHLKTCPIGRRLGRQILFTESDVLHVINSLDLVDKRTGLHASSLFPSKAARWSAQSSENSYREALALASEKPAPRDKRRRGR